MSEPGTVHSKLFTPTVYSKLFVEVLNRQLCAWDWRRAENLAAPSPWTGARAISTDGYACPHHKNLIQVPQKPRVLEHPDCPCCECEVEP